MDGREKSEKEKREQRSERAVYVRAGREQDGGGRGDLSHKADRKKLA